MSEYPRGVVEQDSESSEEQDRFFVLLEDGQPLLYKLDDNGSWEKVHGGKSTLSFAGGAEPGLPEALQPIAEAEVAQVEGSVEGVEVEFDGVALSEYESEDEYEDEDEDERAEHEEAEGYLETEGSPQSEGSSQSDGNEASSGDALEGQAVDPESQDPDETVPQDLEFATVFETFKQGRAGEKKYTYVDEDGDGFYVKVEVEWLTHPNQNRSEIAKARLADKLLAEGTDADDDLFIASGLGTKGGLGADDFVYTEALGHGVIRDFNASEGDRLVFDTGYGLQRAEDIERFVVDLWYDEENQTLAISFGAYGSIEIIGIGADQVSWDLVDILS